MMVNPMAVALWTFTASIGYLVTDTGRGAVWGAVLGMAFSFLASLISLVRGVR